MDSIRTTACAVLFSVLALATAQAAEESEPRRFHVEAYARDATERHRPAYRLHLQTPIAGQLPTSDVALASYVRAALAKHGLREVGPSQTAELEISVSFQIEERVEAAAAGFRRFRPVTHRVRTVEVPLVAEGGTTHNIQQQVAIPTDDGYVASRSRRGNVVRFVKALEIAARTPANLAMGQGSREVWRIRVSNKDECSDPDAYAQLMVSAAVPFIASSTDGRESVVLSRDDPRIIVANAQR
jgi:hypothetical protein